LFQLAETMKSIVGKLAEVDCLGTIKAIKSLKEHARHPARFPAAFVALETGKSLQKGTFPTTPFAWSIIVKGRDGGRELLTAIDCTLDIIEGFQPIDTFRLEFFDINFFEQKKESVSYKITFTCTATGRSRTRI